MSPRRGRTAAALPAPYDAVLEAYRVGLVHTPLAADSRTKYAGRVRGYLVWLAEGGGADVLGDPLQHEAARDGAVRNYKRWLKSQHRTPATINNHLAALSDFYTRLGLGAHQARTEVLPLRAPAALDPHQTRRYLRAVEACPSPRDRAIALLPYYAGLRIGEVVALDLVDIRLSSREGELIVAGKERDGGRQRTLPIHPGLHTVLALWLRHRTTVTGDDQAAVFLNHRGGRLTDRAARTIITSLGAAADLTVDDEPFGPHVLRHTFAIQLVRTGIELVTVADLLGHTRLETTRLYTQPTSTSRAATRGSLATDH
ncbi:tyrosine-type recombinase/integrase [Frankia gtarii]|uniref:tyrosine-type recombinase/integrase n=1 Tax=Frankia gtarii TaxID=2950102 RepID=UPI0021BEABEF|nr:tyrosine-type recombinase/integrase [Frankia gtarii]